MVIRHARPQPAAEAKRAKVRRSLWNIIRDAGIAGIRRRDVMAASAGMGCDQYLEVRLAELVEGRYVCRERQGVYQVNWDCRVPAGCIVGLGPGFGRMPPAEDDAA